jgi:hypothetical protein
MPFLPKCGLVNEFPALNASFLAVDGRVALFLDLDIDLTDVPLEGVVGVGLDDLREKLFETGAEGLLFGGVVLGVELERGEQDARVVYGGDYVFLLGL